MIKKTLPPYLPHVDGLRAIAILAVIAFHGFPEWVSGGFVGVDIFFVISGFLISGIILKGLERGSFSFANFYARRIRRIFPALIVMLATSSLLGYLVLFRNEFRNLGKHVFSGALFVSNIAFWLDTGYFDMAAEHKPLLHLWSLGVEEQFYLIWPLFIYLAIRYRWKTLAAILAVLASSFVLNVWGTSFRPIATFFLPLTRFWELIVGSALAYVTFAAGSVSAQPTRTTNVATFGRWSRNAGAVLGSALIVIAVFHLNRDSAFPGWWALLPTVAAALVIWAGPDAWLNRTMLASRPLVFVGLISYPLYLWHWPLLSFARIVNAGPLPVIAAMALISLAVLLSWATSAFVEKPIRFRHFTSAWPVAGSCVALVCVAAVGLTACYQVTRSRLDNPLTAKIDQAIGDWNYPGGDSNFMRRDNFRLLHQPGRLGAKAIFIGDSHIEQYWERVRTVTSNKDRRTKSAVFATSPGCPPMPETNRLEAGFACDKFFDFAISKAKRQDVDTVVFGAAWEAYFPSQASADQADGPRNPIYRVAGNSRIPLTIESTDANEIFDAFQRNLQTLHEAGKNVYIILPNPTSPIFNPASMLPSRIHSSHVVKGPAYISKTAFAAAVRPVVDKLRTIADATGARLVDPTDYFCEADVCPTATPDGTPLYSDSNHIRPFYVRERAIFVDRILTD